MCASTPSVSEPPRRAAPHYNLQEIEACILKEFETVRRGLDLAVAAALLRDASAARTLIGQRAELEARHAELHGRLLSAISLQAPAAGDLRLAIASLHVNDRIERIGAHCTTIAELSLAIPRAHPPSPAQLRCLGSMARLAQDQLRDAEAIFADRHYEGPWRSSERDLQTLARDRLCFDVAVRGPAVTSREVAFAVTMIARALERIGDNAVDIARQAAFAATGTFGAT